MAARLRIARAEASLYQALAPARPASPALHASLVALIRRHLPGVVGSLLAAPQPSADGRTIEWYSDLAGQPQPLTALPAREQAVARRLLHDRLRSLGALADSLAAEGRSDDADTLRSALVYPDEAAVYVVGGQPVLTFWGYGTTGAPSAPPLTNGTEAEVVAAADARPPGAPRAVRVFPSLPMPSPWLWGTMSVLAVFAVMTWGYYRFTDLPWPPWGRDVKGLLADATTDEGELRLSLERLSVHLDEAQTVCVAEGALAAARREDAALGQRLTELMQDLSSSRELCPLRASLGQTLKEQDNLIKSLTGLQADLGNHIRDCRLQAQKEQRRLEDERKKAEANRRQEAERRNAERRNAEEATKQAQATNPPAPPPALSAPPQQVDPTLPPCPGERPPEKAPDVALVVDASGSMAWSADLNASQIQQMLRGLGGAGPLGAIIGGIGSLITQQASGPNRLEEAKKGVNSVVQTLPSDVDVGLVTLEDCPTASNRGFYMSAQRGVLLQRVNSLMPMQGTPLAQGLIQAGGMVNGIDAPAIIVVVSDGDDSCGGDPCAAARALKAQKPGIKINVVDILGNGAGRCMADATGGKVLKPSSGLDFKNQISNAAQEAMTPAHCRK